MGNGGGGLIGNGGGFDGGYLIRNVGVIECGKAASELGVI